MTDKLLGSISLCRKAGKLTMGTDAVAEQARMGAAKLILTACDFSPRSAKQAGIVCEKYHIASACLPFTMEELARILGKQYGVFAICDSGFAKMITNQIELRQNSENGET